MTRMDRKCRHFYGSCDGIVVRTLVPLFCRKFCYGCHGRRHFYGSYDTDGAGSTAICTEVITRTGQ